MSTIHFTDQPLDALHARRTEFTGRGVTPVDQAVVGELDRRVGQYENARTAQRTRQQEQQPQRDHGPELGL